MWVFGTSISSLEFFNWGFLQTVLCRSVHKNMVSFRPQVHCPHIGPTGGAMCIARDYLQVAMGYPFTETLNSPNASWNGKDLAGLSQNSLDELLKLNTMTIVPTTVAWYSVSSIVLWAILYFSTKGVRFALMRYSSEFRMLSYRNQSTSAMCKSLSRSLAGGYRTQVIQLPRRD